MRPKFSIELFILNNNKPANKYVVYAIYQPMLIAFEL